MDMLTDDTDIFFIANPNNPTGYLADSTFMKQIIGHCKEKHIYVCLLYTSEKYDLYNKDTFEILMTVGGLDIAGLVGVCIGGALYHIPVVLDGVISLSLIHI